jgi:hypothetical protein
LMLGKDVGRVATKIPPRTRDYMPANRAWQFTHLFHSTFTMASHLANI